jgi:hypothetical protein
MAKKRPAKKRKVDPGLERALAHAVALLAGRPEITGVDLGPKYVKGKRQRQQVIRVHVVQKKKGRLGRFAIVPQSFFGVPSDVIEVSYRAHAGPSPARRFDTLQPGISVGGLHALAGTLGLIVYERRTKAPCILSAGHVLCGPHSTIGEAITQPARMDGGSLADIVANLSANPLPGLWGDAALARLNKRRDTSPLLLDTTVRIEATTDPFVGQALGKSGRTSGVTRGNVEGVGTYFHPDMPQGMNGFRVVPEVDNANRLDLVGPGDSGCVYYEIGTNLGVGLHSAGGNDALLGEVGIACNLSTVLTVLDATLTE